MYDAHIIFLFAYGMDMYMDLNLLQKQTTRVPMGIDKTDANTADT